MLVDIDPNNVVAPFAVERVYFLTHTKADRGRHAHKDLRQLAFCPSGACTFVLDDGRERKEVRLEGHKGLIIESMVWREMKDFTHDCVLTVMASAIYDESDYIRDYEEFLALTVPR